MLGQRLAAEWEPLDAVLLIWPQKASGWGGIFDDMVQLYEALVSVICDYADVLIGLPETEIETVRSRLEAMSIPLDYVYFYPVAFDNTLNNTLNNSLVRDCGPITVETTDGLKLLDFIGDDESIPTTSHKITKQLHLQNAFPVAQYEIQDWVLRGSDITVDGHGTLLVRASSELNNLHNIDLSDDILEDRFKLLFGVSNVVWLQFGSLGGGDTSLNDLVHFCPNNTIVYTACDDEEDPLYDELKKMEIELRNIVNAEGESYRLLPLPWPGVMLNDEDQRLPVSYANFLVVNEAVLVPIYNALSDEDALEVIFQAFPGFEIMGIPSEILLESRGSLHRIAMQLPAGILGF